LQFFVVGVLWRYIDLSITATAITVYPTGRIIDTDLCELTEKKTTVIQTTLIVTCPPFRTD